jgi:diketogulonate reductase-like aldo/keto reductase
LDSYILHGPYSFDGISREDLEVWSAMEKLVDSGKTKFIGVSNISAEQLKSLLQEVRIKPTFVQNRCYARTGWDKDVREICISENILYQGFSLLTANRAELSQPIIAEIALKYNKTIPQVVFRFSQQVGMICLTGTTAVEHMKQDLDIDDFELSPAEIEEIEMLSF